ncbi:hypothetical protein RLPCCGM1_p0017 [Rhizobium leguminosarum bv. phaseoli CCGM1]|nr:hypothetical protein RLPCCGM1_p0017 [Rhizobium leguminosarum bv. phaseoli CCGM1]
MHRIDDRLDLIVLNKTDLINDLVAPTSSGICSAGRDHFH